jgi:hypothetical protein
VWSWLKKSVLASPFVRDLVARVARTFVQGFLGVITLSGIGVSRALSQVSVLDKATLAGASAVLALVMGMLGHWAGSNPTSAAFVGPSPGPLNGNVAPPAK